MTQTGQITPRPEQKRAEYHSPILSELGSLRKSTLGVYYQQGADGGIYSFSGVPS